MNSRTGRDVMKQVAVYGLLQTRTTRRRSSTTAGAADAPAPAHQSVPVHGADAAGEQREGAPAQTLEIEEVREGGEQQLEDQEAPMEGGLMSTQELLSEAEGLLAEPLPPDSQDAPPAPQPVRPFP